MPTGAHGPITELARAKVNLTLDVLGKRSDGYHELRSLVAFADFGDSLTLCPADAWNLTCTGLTASKIAGANIVERAALAFAQAWPGAHTGRATLEKHLPVAAGIGGGSADAAATLRALRRLNADIAGGADIDWTTLARSLGADVPVCLESRMSLMRGIGERVQTFSQRHALPAVLVNPGVAVATAAVFAELGAGPLGQPASTIPIQEPAATDDLLALIRGRGNDLEVPARRIAPVIGEVCAALAATAGCQLARMSGSGATCFGLYRTTSAAEAAARAIASDRPDWWVRQTILS